MSSFETGFSSSLAQGMGLGLHARQLEQMNLYRQSQMEAQQERLANAQERLGLYAHNLGDQNDARNRSLDLRERSLSSREGDPGANAAMGQFVVGSGEAPEETRDLYEPDNMGPPQPVENPEFSQFGRDFANTRPDIRHAVAQKLISQGKAERIHKMLGAIANDPRLGDHQKFDAIVGLIDDPEMAKVIAGRMLGPAKAPPQFTPEMVQAMFPTLPEDRIAGMVDASNQAGKILKPTGIVLNPSKLPTRDESEARAADILRGAGIADPENHPSFEIMAYKIEHGKDIDQKTAARMFGDDATGQKIVLSTVGAMAKDATALEKAANNAVAAWRKQNGTKPAPRELLQKQHEAHANSISAHNRWEEALGGVMKSGQAKPVRPPPQTSPVAAPSAVPAPALGVSPTPASSTPAAPAPKAAAPALDANLIQRLHQQFPDADDETILKKHDELIGGATPQGGE